MSRERAAALELATAAAVASDETGRPGEGALTPMSFFLVVEPGS